ncbi:MAG: terminase small subunit [Enterococcus hulanensis]
MIKNEKHQIFADEWLKDMNGTRAYKVAYPHIKKDTTAKANASRLLTDANVKSYIDEQLEKMHNERTADAQEVLEYLTSVMRGEEKDQTLIGLGEGAQGVTEIDVGAKDRIKAAELLGKRHALFTDKVDIDGNIGVTILDDV